MLSLDKTNPSFLLAELGFQEFLSFVESSLDRATAAVHGICDLINRHVVVIAHDDWLCKLLWQRVNRVDQLLLCVFGKCVFFRIGFCAVIDTTMIGNFFIRCIELNILFLPLHLLSGVETDAECNLVEP